MLKRWWPLLLGIAITPPVLLIGFISGGAGHGGYVLARALLPWASELTGIGNFSRWHGTIVVTAAIAQCPLYGLAIAISRKAALPIGLLHLAMVIWLFTGGNMGFSFR